MEATDADDHFPGDDFFPDVDNLFDNMADEDVVPKTSASIAAPYVFVFFCLRSYHSFLF